VLLLTASCIKSGILDKFKFKKNTVDKRLDIDINKFRNLKKQLMQNVIDCGSNIFSILLV
jgi:hypothetical protein